MEIRTKTLQQITVVELSGELDETTSPGAQAEIIALVQPGCKIILDMTEVTYMSSAGFRFLLQTYRTIAAKGGSAALVGLSENLSDTMSITGFLDLFSHYPTLEAGIAALS
jgi:anti-sigma B factor antagonist